MASQAAHNVTFSRHFKAFKVSGVLRRGVHNVIKSVFCPNYSYKTATLGPFTASRERGQKRETKFKPGIHSGLLTDRELSRCVKLLVKYHIPVQAFISMNNQSKYADKLKDQLTIQDYKLMKKKLQPSVTKIFQTCTKLNLTPTATQVAVGSESMRCATSCDLIAENAHGGKVVIEIKTGFMGYAARHTNTNMSIITPAVNDCCLNQFQLQLFLTYQLYRTTFPQNNVVACYVFRIDTLCVDVIPLQSWIKANATRICDAVRCSR